MTEPADLRRSVAQPPIPARPIARLLQKLEAAAKDQGRARTSHEQQEADSHIQTVRLELRAELAALTADRDRLREALLSASWKLTQPQARALRAFDGYEPTDPTNEMQVGMGGVGNVRMVMNRLCEIGLCVQREYLNEDDGYRYELTAEGSAMAKALTARRQYVIESNVSRPTTVLDQDGDSHV